MKKLKLRNSNGAGVNGNPRGLFSRSGRLAILTALLMLLSTGITLAHCDTMEGPVIKDAKLALDVNNINYALKWIRKLMRLNSGRPLHLQ